MPIRGDRLRWPPRPGRKSSEATGTRRSLTTDNHPLKPNQPLQQPDERDQSADQQVSKPRGLIKQAHDDLESKQQDTDCRTRAAEVIDRASIKKRTGVR
jgi:hypothetical protein